MKWSKLPTPWQVCFEEAWAGFISGSFPIGACVTDANGAILARGHNRIYDDRAREGQIYQHQLAHAELNTLLQIDRRNTDVHSCTLFTSLEPCPLCMGAIYMSGIRTLHFAARDAYAGSTNLLGTTPYLARKNVKAHGPATSELEILFLGVQVSVEIRRKQLTGWELFETVTETWRKECPLAVAFGEFLYSENVLGSLAQSGKSTESIFNTLIHLLSNERLPVTP